MRHCAMFRLCSTSTMRVDRPIRLALRVLADAVARAHCGEVERTWGHRLALELLVSQGIAERWQAAEFWDHLAMQWHRPDNDHGTSYVQITHLNGAVTAWYRRAGLEPPDTIEMSRLARPYQPDLAFDCGTQQLPCMCNRYTPGERHRIEETFSAVRLREFNEGPAIVHPREPGWVVRQVDGKRVLEQMTWGFPVYLRGKAGQPLKPKPVNNARFDKLGSFWKRWAANPANRCIVPAAAYAEAVGPSGSMTTTWLSVKDTPIFGWAGLWRPSDEWGACYTSVMTDHAPELAAIHDRAPVILDREDWDIWLHAPFEELRHFDRPWPAVKTNVLATTTPWKIGGEALPGGLLV